MTNFKSTNYTWDTTTVSHGLDYLFKAEVFSTGGLNTAFITSRTFTIDNTPPNMTINSPVSQTYTTELINVAFSGDAAHYWYYIETVDTQNKTWTTSIDRTLPDGTGTYTLHAYGNDSVGNIVYSFVTFTILSTLTTPVTSEPSTSTSKVTPVRTTFLLLMVLVFFASIRPHKKKS